MFEAICEAPTAPFCVSAEYAAASETSGMYVLVDATGNRIVAAPDAVERLGVLIQWVSNDSFTRIEPTELLQVCEDDACAVFRRACSAAGTTCVWQAGVRSPDKPTWLSEVRISAQSLQAMHLARNNVFVRLGDGTEARLSLARVEAAVPAPEGEYVAPSGEFAP